MAFQRVASMKEVPPETMRDFTVNGKTIALANVSGKLFAVNNECLHMGGPLGEGTLDGQTVTCPWHGWQYDVTTGKVITNPSVCTDTYAVEVRGIEIFVDV